MLSCLIVYFDNSVMHGDLHIYNVNNYDLVGPWAFSFRPFRPFDSALWMHITTCCVCGAYFSLIEIICSDLSSFTTRTSPDDSRWISVYEDLVNALICALPLHHDHHRSCIISHSSLWSVCAAAAAAVNIYLISSSFYFPSQSSCAHRTDCIDERGHRLHIYGKMDDRDQSNFF